MQGNEKVLAALNDLLAEELTAINQYMVHAEMCDNWGYARLHDRIEKRAIAEMRHAEALIERILFLDGTPRVDRLNAIRIGKDVQAQLRNDLDLELAADRQYNGAVRLADEQGDNGTRDLLAKVLKDEEGHIDEIEAQLAQIEQMGIQNFLSDQTSEKA
jgi:bacterioferritin